MHSLLIEPWRTQYRLFTFLSSICGHVDGIGSASGQRRTRAHSLSTRTAIQFSRSQD